MARGAVPHMSGGDTANMRQEEEEREGEDRRGVCERLLRGVRTYFPQFVEEDTAAAVTLVEQAYEWADRRFGVKEAKEWAEGYSVP